MRPMTSASRENVFINCPYDATYDPILRAIVFTVCFLGFKPRMAKERADSGTARIDRIIDLVRRSRYAIHDLSRLRATRRGEYYRMNMPFELGLDIGCRVFGGVRFKAKRCMVFEKEKYKLLAALSDLSNSDVYSHRDRPALAVRHVRNWLAHEACVDAPGGTAIWYAFNDFMADLHRELIARGFRKADIMSLPFPEFLRYITQWIKRRIELDGRVYQ